MISHFSGSVEQQHNAKYSIKVNLIDNELVKCRKNRLRCNQTEATRESRKSSRSKFLEAASYPGDGERHVEVLPALQPEAPGAGSGQRHVVGAHSSRRLKDHNQISFLKKPHSCWRDGRKGPVASGRRQRKGSQTGERGGEDKTGRNQNSERKTRKRQKKRHQERRKTCLLRGAAVTA